VGVVCNGTHADDSSGPFYCTTLTPHSLSPGLGISSSFPISVCSSRGNGDGRPGAYSVTMPLIATHGGARSTGAVQASRANYGYLGDIPFGEAVPRTIQGAQDLWERVSQFLKT